jgi:transcriptional regulator with XRE-family HTH domain
MLNMNIDSDLVKQLRSQKHWSQEQLGDACGLSLRTVQRLESSGKASTETVRALAAVFEISPDDLITDGLEFALTPVDAVKTCLTKYADFTGTASRAEYWWFFLFVAIVAVLVTLINESAYQIVAVFAFLPLLAAGTRRL